MRKGGDDIKTYLSHHTELSFRLESIQHHDDVLMSQFFQDVDLPPEVLQILLGLSSFGHELESHDLARVLASAFEDLPESAFSDWVKNVILFHSN